MKKDVCLLFNIMLNMILLLMSQVSFSAGDPQAGQVKSVVCAACHGAAGESPSAIWPHLAGQHAAYLMKQLNDFQVGTLRHADLMTPFVATLSHQDMMDLAAFYAGQTPVTPKKKESPLMKRGEQLYRQGDVTKHITACIACHGPKGHGSAEAGFPWLAGQHEDYAVQQLKAFKTGTRKNDLNGIMHDITSRMDEADMVAISHYLVAQKLTQW